FSWPNIDVIVMHYRGSGNNPVPKDVAAYLRASQRSYLTSRGYSLGYNTVVVSDLGHPDDGVSWEVRGERFRSAANAPQALNVRAFTIQVCQVDNAPLTPKAVAAIRDLVA